MQTAKLIKRHERLASMAGQVAEAATRLESFHSGLAKELKKLADAAQGCTGQSRVIGSEVAGPSPARFSHERETV